ncbi:hypothetical protein LQU94_06175 [Peptoniphilus sp. KCTC 25270]|uniref:hypothetical protein n=1 Tax=Peptoniphilus sp. KCTC 25270 TaxID=2897414 RepID=UPI001E601A9C|nr:hypothetical protein [Peptoniphilus sp. KCTC 25270]MCD1147697.1 hypothetical protein [Peptoniphilus sp. KCTC 25270]
MMVWKGKKLYFLEKIVGFPKKNIETVSFLGGGAYEMMDPICVGLEKKEIGDCCRKNRDFFAVLFVV